MFVMGDDSTPPAPPPPVERYQVSTGAGISVIVDSVTGQAWMFNAGGAPHSDGGFFDLKPK